MIRILEREGGKFEVGPVPDVFCLRGSRSHVH